MGVDPDRDLYVPPTAGGTGGYWLHRAVQGEDPREQYGTDGTERHYAGLHPAAEWARCQLQKGFPAMFRLSSVVAFYKVRGNVDDPRTVFMFVGGEELLTDIPYDRAVELMVGQEAVLDLTGEEQPPCP